MEMRFTFHDGGEVEIESISILEDLWHDYQFFKAKALQFEQQPGPSDRFLAKRYGRAAVLMLAFYVEGVVNRWLKHLLPGADWTSIERGNLAQKIQALEDRLSLQSGLMAAVGAAKGIRDALAHLKPGGDLQLYDAITAELLKRTEADTTVWLAEIETAVGVSRHRDTAEESRPFREALGVEASEATAYSGDLDD